MIHRWIKKQTVITTDKAKMYPKILANYNLEYCFDEQEGWDHAFVNHSYLFEIVCLTLIVFFNFIF